MSRYESSEKHLQRALRSIPLGSQTFSKSYLHYPQGVSPFFIDSGKGAYVTDIDGNQYIDLVSALAAVTLGYCDSDVDEAVIDQIKSGTVFSLPGILETTLAEKLIELIPCAEMARFGKNASDATTAAIRIARACTKRDRIAVCGYHGWHDWYIGSTPKNKGVPEVVSKLTSSFSYNNLNSLKAVLDEFPGEFAAVILEPMNTQFPENGFLEGVKELTHKAGSLLIFDETVTGFRLSLGGAQELFGVIPDLACFGKGMANGYPISAVVGKEKYMKCLDDVFFSFTYGGELLSIRAALASINKLESERVLEKISKSGSTLLKGTDHWIKEFELTKYLSLSGHENWSFLNFTIDDESLLFEIKTLFMQETLKNGLITLGSHNLTYSHDERVINKILEIYEMVFPVIKASLDAGSAVGYLKCEPLKPLFKARK